MAILNNPGSALQQLNFESGPSGLQEGEIHASKAFCFLTPCHRLREQLDDANEELVSELGRAPAVRVGDRDSLERFNEWRDRVTDLLTRVMKLTKRISDCGC